jgi:hypothetical protein
MRTTVTAILVGLALLAVSASAGAAPETTRVYFMKDGFTGDQGVSFCGTNRTDEYNQTRYETPMYYVDLYRSMNNAEVGTAGWSGTPLYHCKRSAALGRTDEYLSTDPSCTVTYYWCGYDYNQCASWYYDKYGNPYYCEYYGAYGCWNSYYYGTRVDASRPMGYTVSAQYEGSANVPLYVCSVTAYDRYGGYWTEFRIDPNACGTGATQYMFLGYARSQSNTGNMQDGQLTDPYQQCVEGSGCFGECGKNCDGIFGAHYSTSECLAHDRCVCRNNGNIWALDCLGDFLAAGISFVVKAFTSLVETVVGWIISGLKSIVRFLCFWC